MLEITAHLRIPDDSLEYRYVRSGGPGGQNVNKVATKVELRLRLARCEALSPAVKQRLREAYPGYVTREDDLVVAGSRYRTQHQNRRDVEQRLAAMVRRVLVPRPPRKRTRVTLGAKHRRLQAKRRRSELKRGRRHPAQDDW